METVVLQRIMNEGGGVVIKITSVTELLAANDEIWTMCSGDGEWNGGTYLYVCAICNAMYIVHVIVSLIPNLIWYWLKRPLKSGLYNTISGKADSWSADALSWPSFKFYFGAHHHSWTICWEMTRFEELQCTRCRYFLVFQPNLGQPQDNLSRNLFNQRRITQNPIAYLQISTSL